MQLTKSKKSAFILSAILVLSFAITTATADILIPYLFSGDITAIVENPETISQSGSILGLLFFLIIVLSIMIVIGAFWLYRFFGERHFGQRGALRWALFGITFALLMQGFDLIFRDRLEILKFILQFLSIFAAYFITRALVPMERKS